MTRPRFRPYFRHGLLPQLIAFEACLRLGGVTRAARELCLAQPTVSGMLRKLSETVGEPVLVTGGGRVEPTEAGREVARLCEDIFGSLERFEAERARRREAPEPGHNLKQNLDPPLPGLAR
ncbi:MAG TPA: LysR family transcriptional regulator [Usitatibacter sp.]|nr:LysR family transcriptional regulator [Usitatibacter sp.]